MTDNKKEEFHSPLIKDYPTSYTDKNSLNPFEKFDGLELDVLDDKGNKIGTSKINIEKNRVDIYLDKEAGE